MPLDLTDTLGVGGGGGVSKELDISIGNFGQKSRKYKNKEGKKEKASMQMVRQSFS